MSEGYTFDHVLQECVGDRAGGMPGDSFARRTLFVESWNALNSWIESRMRKEKGAEIGMLGTFSWETKKIDGGTQIRPIFLVNSSFVKDHGVRGQRNHSIPATAHNETINYSKLAIKFSNTLTKDIIFSCLRDIFKKIGEYVDRCYRFEIAFSFGKLKSSQKRIKFEFNYAKLGKIVPEGLEKVDNLTTDTSFTSFESNNVVTSNTLNESSIGRESVTSQNNTHAPEDNSRNNSVNSTRASSAALRSSRSTTSISARSSLPIILDPINNNFNIANSSGKIPSLPLGNLSSGNLLQPIQTNSENNNSNNNNDPNNNNSGIFYNIDGYDVAQISPALHRLLTTYDDDNLENNKTERRQIASDHVLEQAYVRCLGTLESQARQEDSLNYQLRSNYDEWIKSQKKRKEDKKAQMSTLESFLKKQIDEYNKRRQIESAERKSARISTELPGYFPRETVNGFPCNRTSSGDGPPPNKHTNADELLEILEHQIRTNKDKKLRAKEQVLEEEREYLEHVAMELDMQSAAERAAHLEKQKTLLEAWEREAHIRNLKKLQRRGQDAIQSYMRTNLSETDFNASHSNSMKSFAGAGVGFDSRKKTINK